MKDQMMPSKIQRLSHFITNHIVFDKICAPVPMRLAYFLQWSLLIPQFDHPDIMQ